MVLIKESIFEELSFEKCTSSFPKMAQGQMFTKHLPTSYFHYRQSWNVRSSVLKVESVPKRLQGIAAAE